MEVQFNKEDFDVEIDGPSGKTKRTIIPGCGMDKIQAQFKPMIKGDKVLMTEKEFYTLNPYNGAPEKNLAKIMGRFSGKFGPKPFKGRYIDIVREKGGERIFLSNEGLLMKVETPMDYFLYIEEVPR